MSKSRGRKDKRKRPPKPPPQLPSRKESSKIRKAIEWFLGIVTVLGTIAGLVAFFPRVSVDAETLYDPSHPSPMSFRITNTGFVTINDVTPSIGLCEFKFINRTIGAYDKGHVMDCDAIDYASVITLPNITNANWHIKQLTMDERWTVRIDNFFYLFNLDDDTNWKNIRSMNMVFIVTYKPWILPITRQKAFRFKTETGKDGKLYWQSIPMEK